MVLIFMSSAKREKIDRLIFLRRAVENKISCSSFSGVLRIPLQRQKTDGKKAGLKP